VEGIVNKLCCSQNSEPTKTSLNMLIKTDFHYIAAEFCDQGSTECRNPERLRQKPAVAWGRDHLEVTRIQTSLLQAAC
jgi:hypothetical protein